MQWHASFLKVFLVLVGPVALGNSDCDRLLNIYQGVDIPAEDVRTLVKLRDQQVFVNDTEPEKAAKVATDRLRQHAWDLFDSMTRPLSSNCADPIWRTWYQLGARKNGSGSSERMILTDLFASLKDLRSRAATPGIGPPPQARTKEGSCGDTSSPGFPAPILEGIYFNRRGFFEAKQALGSPAAEWLAEGRREIAPFSAEAIAIKTIWHVIRKGCYQAIGKWDSSDAGRQGQTRTEDSWKQCIFVFDPTYKGPKSNRLCFDPGQPTSVHAVGSWVSAEKFYTVVVDQRMADQLSGTAAKPNPGDTLILVGLHVATKEIPDWFWATFWWRSDPSDVDEQLFGPTRDIRNRKWRNYLGTVAVSARYPSNDKALWRPAYNPYAEGSQLPNGTNGNCLTCHRLAGVTAQYGGLTADLLAEFTIQPRVVDSTNGESTFNSFRALELDQGWLRTDFLWSLAIKLADDFKVDQPSQAPAQRH